MGADQQVYLDDIEVGDELPSLVKTCTTRQLVMWAAASGDFYEIHYDLGFAAANRLDGLLVHGALKHAFLGQLLHDWVAPGGRITSFGCSYRGTDGPGEPLTCRGVVTAVDPGRREVAVDVWIEKADGTVTTKGPATVELPLRSGTTAGVP
jgi:acyl dehydratase